MSDEYRGQPLNPGSGACAEDSLAATSNFERLPGQPGKYVTYNCASGGWQPVDYNLIPQNNSFETGRSVWPHYWRRSSLFNLQVCDASCSDGGPYWDSGSYYLAMNSGVDNDSMYQWIPEAVVPGRGYSASVAVRCPRGPCDVQLRVWAKDYPEQWDAEQFNGGWQHFEVWQGWQVISASTAGFANYHNFLQFQVFFKANQQVNLDAAWMARW